MQVVEHIPPGSRYLTAMIKEMNVDDFIKSFEAIWAKDLYVQEMPNGDKYFYIVEPDDNRFLRQNTYAWGWIDCRCSLLK